MSGDSDHPVQLARTPLRCRRASVKRTETPPTRAVVPARVRAAIRDRSPRLSAGRCRLLVAHAFQQRYLFVCRPVACEPAASQREPTAVIEPRTDAMPDPATLKTPDRRPGDP